MPGPGDDAAPGSPQSQQSLQSQQTWREYAGREDGGENYRFGDVMRGLRRRIDAGGGSGREAGASAGSADVGGAACSGEQRYLQEIALLRAELDAQREEAAAETSRCTAAAQRWGLLLGLAVGLVLELVAWLLSTWGAQPWATKLFPLASLGLLLVGVTLSTVLLSRGCGGTPAAKCAGEKSAKT